MTLFIGKKIHTHEEISSTLVDKPYAYLFVETVSNYLQYNEFLL